MKAKARRTDPQPSHDAARDIEASGKAGKHRETIIMFLNDHSDFHYSCHEIAHATGLTYHQVQRRMKELEGEGALRMPDMLVCMLTGRTVTHWQYGHGSPPPALKPKHIDGLRCWACRDDDGQLSFIIGEEPRKISGSYGFDDDGFLLDIIDFRGLPTGIFPKSIKPGECKQIVIPMAVIVERD